MTRSQIFAAASLLLFGGAAGMRVEESSLREDLSVDATAEAEKEKVSRDICNRRLMISYDDGDKKAEKNPVAGSFRFAPGGWDGVEFLVKQNSETGCTQRYLGACSKGGIEVIKSCPGKEDASEVRCLAGFLCMTSSRKTEVDANEHALIKDGGDSVAMSSGKVQFWTEDPEKGLNLIDAPGNYKWKVEPGCYCCQHRWNIIDDPFSLGNLREAWKKRSDGNMECMLAYRDIGKGMNHENIPDSSVGGVFLMVPEAVLTFADRMTLGIFGSGACAAACAARNEKFENNKYYLTKW